MLTVPKKTELWLRKGADRRLRAGHCWLYSNEIDSDRCRLGDYEPGQTVTVNSSSGHALASAYVDPTSLICARVYAHEPDRELDSALLIGRLESALRLRQRFFDAPYYRLIYGDSDGLPGVVVDRFGDYLVLQLNNAAIEQHESELISALEQVLQPLGILLRADSRERKEQNLPDRVEVALGEVPDQVPLIENGVHFMAPVRHGQKTGWFYDHRVNRERLRHYVDGARVLDVYSYVGGWGVQAAVFGAQQVVCLDSSATALEAVSENARLNSVEQRVEVLGGRADQSLRALAEAGELFDVVVLDPPAFVQRRRDLGKGRKAYQRINELALKVLAPGGVLVSASCSMLLTPGDLAQALQNAARRSGRELRLVEQGRQGPDHPVHPAIPETEYLKALYAIALD